CPFEGRAGLGWSLDLISLFAIACPAHAGSQSADQCGDRRDGARRLFAIHERAGDRVTDGGADDDTIGIAADDRGVVGGLDAAADGDRQPRWALYALDGLRHA